MGKKGKKTKTQERSDRQNQQRNNSKKHANEPDPNPDAGNRGQIPPDVTQSMRTHEELLLPAGTIWVVHMAVLILRCYVVSQKVNWWILHPDEVYQSMEVAHGDVYGYGFRPYEFLPPPQENSSSVAEQQEAALGMYSLRPFFIPRLYMLVFHLADLTGLGLSPFLVGKVFHAVIAAHLPLAVYICTKVIFHSSDVATLAAIFVALSEHLTVLGTHTLTNSLLAPGVFLIIALLVSTLELPSQLDMQRSNFFAELTKVKKEDDHSYSDENDTDDMSTDDNSPSRSWSATLARTLRIIVLGVFLGILIYIRVDLGLFLAITLGAICFPLHVCIWNNMATILLLLVGFLLGCILGGADDFYCYGVWFISPAQWFKFNVYNDFTSVMFGFSGIFTYVKEIILYSLITVFQTWMLAMCLIFSIVQKKHPPTIDKQAHMGFLKVLTAAILLFIVYSGKGHKEVRFLHNFIVLFQICSAFTFVYFLELFRQRGVGKQRARMKIIVILIAMVYLSYQHFPSPTNQSNDRWTYKHAWDSNYINDCLDFIRQQDDVKGIFSDRSIHISGGYTALHRDVPIFTLVHYEFQEFSKQSRKSYPSVDIFTTDAKFVDTSVLSRVSNFISIENAFLVLKFLILQPEYNYFLIKMNRQLMSTGFEEIYHSGTMRVMRRSTDPEVNKELLSVAESIAVGTNGTVLEYEGSWLTTLGLHELAKERLETAIALEPLRVRPYQMLAILYKQAGDIKKAREIAEKCYGLLDKDTCHTKQPKVVLHHDYGLEDMNV